MTKKGKFFAALAIGLSLAALPAFAQVTETAPIKIKAPKPRIAQFEGFVMSSNRVAITVRDKDNMNLVRTFSMGERLQPNWERRYDSEPYQYGDRVKIHYIAGTDTAVKIKGRPSRPL